MLSGRRQLGLLAVAWPLAWACQDLLVASLSGLAVRAAAVLRWRPGPALAAAAAVISCAFSAAGPPSWPPKTFILAYLLAADAPSGRARPGPWLSRQTPVLRPGIARAPS